MATVSCPSCGERGKVPENFPGGRIKCRKCGTAFQVGGAGAKAATATATATATTPAATTRQPQGDEIVVEGLDDAAWATTTVPTAVEHHDEPPTSFDPHLQGVPVASGPRPAKQYKVLWPKDRYFEGKFDLARLEEALNHFAREGWIVRGMATPHIVSFQGEKEELVILLER